MNISSNYIWQRRIHHGVRNQKNAVPFPVSVEIGLEFNAALERKEKLDLHLLTNAVMLELCDFARTVTKSEAYFLFEMLDFNFDLGVDTDNDSQCYEYRRRVHDKIKLLKEQIKMKPQKWKENFLLPDLNTIMAYTESEQQRHSYPKRNKTVDSSFLTAGCRNSQSVENKKSESNEVVSSACIMHSMQEGVFTPKLTDDNFSFCKELGVTLIVRANETPKQKLDRNLLTNGVMVELLYFSRVLCGTQSGIVHDLVKQNFGLSFSKVYLWPYVSWMMARKNACQTVEERDAFRKEPFKVQGKKREYSKMRQKADTDYEELERLTMDSKRRRTPKHRDNDVKEICQDVDLSYMCPVDCETNMQSDEETGREKLSFESCLSGAAADTNPVLLLDVKQEEDEFFVSSVQPQTNLFELCSENTTLKSNVLSEDKTAHKNVKTLKQKLWMRRHPRSKQILKSSKVNDKFARCREIGLVFNVASGNKQNLDLQLLTNCVLWEVYKFATAMSRSLRSFLLDILDNNFKLAFVDENHRHNVLLYILTKENTLQNLLYSQKMDFLSRPFQFPQIYNMSNVISEFQTVQDIETEQQTNWDSPAPATVQQAAVESHPFCNKLGINLWSTEQRPTSQKLDLSFLTRGAVLEILTFIRELCGSVPETVNDVLEHNFDLDLQSGKTEAAQVIERWYVVRKSIMKKPKTSLMINTWLSMVVPLNRHSQLGPEPMADNSLEDLDMEDFKPGTNMEAFSGNVPQVERVNSYHICKEIGLDLDVSSKSITKTKLDFRLLTRRVLFEMHQYVVENSLRYVPALYKILEYNFDLSSQNHRRVEFAWSIASQVIAMAGKRCRNGNYLNQVFELPFQVSESSQIVCKEEQEDDFREQVDDSDIMFVQELKPVDIEVVVD